MAFPIPSHLPRSRSQQEKSSQILSKISETTVKTLKADVVSAWVADLDLAIQQSKDRIYDLIHTDLQSFDRQLSSSKSVQTRLQSLTSNVDESSDSLSNPESGLMPKLVKKLGEHSALAQQATDANKTYHVLTHLSRCNSEFLSLSSIVQEGKLAEAVSLCQGLEGLVGGAPEPLPKADVMVDLKRKFRALRDRVEEQLGDAYSRSIRVSSSEVAISPAVQVRQSQAIISLSEIWSSLSPTSLSANLLSLRRDLIAHFMESPLQQPVSVTVSSSKDPQGAPAHIFSLFPSSSTASPPPLQYLATLLRFLAEHLFPTLPEPDRTSFPQGLSMPTTTAVLRRLLVPSLPSTLQALPGFLALVKEADEFERTCIGSLLGGVVEREVASWAENVGRHYGRKRRIDLLERARVVILQGLGKEGERTIRVEVPEPQSSEVAPGPAVVPVQGEDDDMVNAGAWDFDDSEDANVNVNGSGHEAQDRENGKGWGFDDERSSVRSGTGPEASIMDPPEVEDDSSDAWGWNDEDDDIAPADSSPTKTNNVDVSNGHNEGNETEETVWDDAWDKPPSPPPSPPPLSASQPKLAKRLEKFSAKGKHGVNTVGVSPHSSAPSSPAVSRDVSVAQPQNTAKSKAAAHSLSVSVPQSSRDTAAMKETYTVSGFAQDILKMVEDVLKEGDELSHSRIFDDFLASLSTSPPPLASRTSSSTASPGSLVLLTAPSILDLFRALHTSACASELARLPARIVRFSNDCLFLGGEAEKLLAHRALETDVLTAMRDAVKRLTALGELWFDAAIETQRDAVKHSLTRANGFVDTADQEFFDEGEAAVSQVLRDILSVGRKWKITLARSKYYHAIGTVVDTALTKVMADVLALPDIPEVESHKLSELCRILHALEQLFVDDADTQSLVVAYVPSWLKFSYLSELLEASIADISYLFDEGALVDFEPEELASLVRALFADTPLRANTVAKLMGGHPESR